MQNTAKVQNCATLLLAAFGASLQMDLRRNGVGLALGAGLDNLASLLEDATSVHFFDLPGFPEARVASHARPLVDRHLLD